MRLGELIDTLATMPPDAPVYVDGNPALKLISYRGYYDQLTVMQAGQNMTPVTAGELHKLAEEADGGWFTGYKGGEYNMDRNTPVWAADYSETGPSIGSIEYRDRAVHIVAVDVSDYAGF